MRRDHGKIKWRKTAAAVAAVLMAGIGANTAHAQCSTVSISRAQLPERLNLYALQGRTITLAKSVSQRDLPATVVFEDCGDPAHYGFTVGGILYLVRQAEIAAVSMCFRLAGSPRRPAATAGSGNTRTCPESR